MNLRRCKEAAGCIGTGMLIPFLVPLFVLSHFQQRAVRRRYPQHWESLSRFLASEIEEIERKDYEYWMAQEYPIVYEVEFEGREMQVEILALERKPDYIHLQVDASNYPVGWSVTENQSTIIYKKGSAE
jgi:hypothetical protein